MYIWFSENRSSYQRGQIAPFLIAMTAVMIVLFMITANLGKIAEYQIDVSNAADAGALATASVLSGQLLGLGIRSDAMAGYAFIQFIFIAYALLSDTFPGDLILFIMIYIVSMIHQYMEYITALGQARIAWTTAKKTGIQYAFSNIGISEPKPTFQEFMRNVYSLSPEQVDSMAPSQLRPYYDIYTKGDDPTQSDGTRRQIKWNSSGKYGLFMSEDEGGYWNDTFGEIDPGSLSQSVITTGYGWTINDDDTVTSSFNPSALKNDPDYKVDYENFAEVEMIGALMYPLEVLEFMDMDFYESLMIIFLIIYGITGWIKYFEEFEDSWWGAIIATILVIIIGAIAYFLIGILPAGLEMDDIEKQTDLNYITITTKKGKQPKDLGMWEFTYEGSVGQDKAFASSATSHVFRETGTEDITPAFPYDEWDFNSLFSELGGEDPEEPDWGLFETEKHLFESELVQVWY